MVYFYPKQADSIESVAAADHDEVISTRYYDLQGRMVTQAQRGSIYVVKEQRQSGKTTVKKVAR